MYEAVIEILGIIATLAGLALIFALLTVIVNGAERIYKRYKRNKRRRQKHRRNRIKTLRQHEAACQFKLTRTIWQLEDENIKLNSRKINRQTITINGVIATPQQRAEFLKGVKKNG